jgi:hypothetical protein
MAQLKGKPQSSISRTKMFFFAIFFCRTVNPASNGVIPKNKNVNLENICLHVIELQTFHKFRHRQSMNAEYAGDGRF